MKLIVIEFFFIFYKLIASLVLSNVTNCCIVYIGCFSPSKLYCKQIFVQKANFRSILWKVFYFYQKIEKHFNYIDSDYQFPLISCISAENKLLLKVRQKVANLNLRTHLKQYIYVPTHISKYKFKINNKIS